MATDLADVNPGEDLWRYDYRLSDFPYTADHGFSILFDVSLVGDISDPPPVGPDWDVISIDPDPGLPDDGLYDALALVDSPSVDGLFTVEFIWTGGPATPGSQRFEVFDPNFATIEVGETIAFVASPIPEPHAALMFGVSFLLVGRSLRKTGGRLF